MKRILNSFKFREPQRLTFQNDMRKIPLYKKWAKPLPHFYYLRPLTLTLSPKRGEGILCVIAGMTRNRTIAATLQKLPLPFPPLQKGGLGSSLFVYCSSSPFAIHIMALISFYLNCKKESPENFPDFLFYQFYFLLNQFFNFSSKYFRIQFDTRAHCCCKVN